MKKDSEKVSEINVELALLRRQFHLTLDYDVLLSIRRVLREAFDAGFRVDVQLRRGARPGVECLRAYSYGELEYLDLRVEDIESIFCQRVVSCK